MMQSWHNFFFASYDPGGFITVDKPPVALWIQTLFAKAFGFSGFVILLPQAMAQVVSVAILYKLVKKTSGTTAGLIAAFTLAIMPINVALSRTNEVDGILVLVLVCAAWAFLKALESQKLFYLLLSFTIIGVGFNTKMLEAYIALPAFIIAYFLSSTASWRKKIRNLIAAGVVLLIISFSWILAVDFTPAASRPYVGSSQTNSELNLAIGYNGIERITGMFRGRRPEETQARPQVQPEANSRNFTAPRFMNGSPSLWRLFNSQLGSQLSWLIPLAFIAFVGIIAVRKIRFPLSVEQETGVFWGTWLISGFIVFSVASSTRAYYTAILGPAIAALIGIGCVTLFDQYHSDSWRGWLLPAAIAATVSTQIIILSYTPAYAKWLIPTIVSVSAIALFILIASKINGSFPLKKYTAYAFMISLTVLSLPPAIWATYSTFHPVNTSMPSAGPSTQMFGNVGDRQLPDSPESFLRSPRGFTEGDFGRASGTANTSLIQYLEANQGSAKFLVATPNSMSASPIILATGKPVMALGGFSGSDNVLSLTQLQQDIADGTVRYFLLSSFSGFGDFEGNDGGPVLEFPNQHSGISNQFPGGNENIYMNFRARGGFEQFGASSALTQWVEKTCKPVPNTVWQNDRQTAPSAGNNGNILYDCSES